MGLQLTGSFGVSVPTPANDVAVPRTNTKYWELPTGSRIAYSLYEPSVGTPVRPDPSSFCTAVRGTWLTILSELCSAKANERTTLALEASGRPAAEYKISSQSWTGAAPGPHPL
jgi:hypothetical protein